MHGYLSNALLLANSSNISSSYTYQFSASPPYSFDTLMAAQTNSSSTLILTNSNFYDAAVVAEFELLTAISRLTNVSGISLTGVSSGADIQIIGIDSPLYLVNSTTPVGGFAFPPDWSTTGYRNDMYLTDYSHMVTNFGSVQRVVSHELNHTIGLLDATSVSGLSSAEKNERFTVMGYAQHQGGLGHVDNLQLYDIAALQSLYGRSSSGSTNNSYGSFTKPGGTAAAFSIWDSGGIDEISSSSINSAALIDLRPGHFSSIGPSSLVNATTTLGSATILSEGFFNISIAFGTYIENATGSSHNDIIIGNELSNILHGGDGDDIIFGTGLDYIPDPGKGDYNQVGSTGTISSAPVGVTEFVSSASLQKDEIHGGSGNDILRGTAGEDNLFGEDDNDYLYGGDGGDILSGGVGDDYLDSGLNAYFSVGGAWDDLAGGEGNDALIMRGEVAFASGGLGADEFWVESQQQSAQYLIKDADPDDSIYWNGYKLSGGPKVVLEFENDVGASATVGAYDANGFTYEVVPGWAVGGTGNALIIVAPRSQVSDPIRTLILYDFESGDGGITAEAASPSDVDFVFNSSTNEYDLVTSLPVSPIINDSIQANYYDLPGASTSWSNHGPNSVPLTWA